MHDLGEPGWQSVARRTAEVAADHLGDVLRAVYVHGSAALGGWGPGSDLDMLLVVEPPRVHDWTTVGEALAQTGSGIPLELSVVAAAAARHPAPPWPFLLHVTTHPGQERLVLGSSMPGDSDLLLHYAVCRAHGLRLFGPQPAQCIGAVPRVLVLDGLADELAWAVAHADAKYIVLNACRAHAFAATGRLLSKLEGARWARSMHPRFESLIAQAERAQSQGTELGPADVEALALVRAVQESLV